MKSSLVNEGWSHAEDQLNDCPSAGYFSRNGKDFLPNDEPIHNFVIAQSI